MNIKVSILILLALPPILLIQSRVYAQPSTRIFNPSDLQEITCFTSPEDNNSDSLYVVDMLDRTANTLRTLGYSNKAINTTLSQILPESCSANAVPSTRQISANPSSGLFFFAADIKSYKTALVKSGTQFTAETCNRAMLLNLVSECNIAAYELNRMDALLSSGFTPAEIYYSAVMTPSQRMQMLRSSKVMSSAPPVNPYVILAIATTNLAKSLVNLSKAKYDLQTAKTERETQQIKLQIAEINRDVEIKKQQYAAAELEAKRADARIEERKQEIAKAESSVIELEKQRDKYRDEAYKAARSGEVERELDNQKNANDKQQQIDNEKAKIERMEMDQTKAIKEREEAKNKKEVDKRFDPEKASKSALEYINLLRKKVEKCKSEKLNLVIKSNVDFAANRAAYSLGKSFPIKPKSDPTSSTTLIVGGEKSSGIYGNFTSGYNPTNAIKEKDNILDRNQGNGIPKTPVSGADIKKTNILETCKLDDVKKRLEAVIKQVLAQDLLEIENRLNARYEVKKQASRVDCTQISSNSQGLLIGTTKISNEKQCYQAKIDYFGLDGLTGKEKFGLKLIEARETNCKEKLLEIITGKTSATKKCTPIEDY